MTRHSAIMIEKRANGTSGGEAGLALVGFLAVLLPLIGLAGTMMTAMGGRNDRLIEEVRLEQALQAAEAGIDEANYRGATGKLQDGVTFSRTLPGGASFTVVPTHLLKDLEDNDGDAQVDEEDEDVFQVVVTGTYVGARRRLVAYVQASGGEAAIKSALSVYHQTPQIQIDFKGVGHITGYDTNMDGSAGPEVVTGIAIEPPADVGDLTANFATDDPSRITGSGGTPSLDQVAGPDLVQLVQDAKSQADIVLGDSYTSGSWGDGPAGDFNVIYREGDLALDGYIQGAGLLVVTGKLQVYGGFRFDGVIVILGDIQADGSSRGGILINGALLKGDSTKQIQFADRIALNYSSEAISLTPIIGGGATSGGGATAGWREIGTR